MRIAHCFFRSGQFAFTADSDSKRLPKEGEPWTPYNRVAQLAVAEEGLPDDLKHLERNILIGLETDGYYITTLDAVVNRVHFVDLAEARRS